jgi:hypothetical protein
MNNEKRGEGKEFNPFGEWAKFQTQLMENYLKALNPENLFSYLNPFLRGSPVQGILDFQKKYYDFFMNYSKTISDLMNQIKDLKPEEATKVFYEGILNFYKNVYEGIVKDFSSVNIDFDKLFNINPEIFKTYEQYREGIEAYYKDIVTGAAHLLETFKTQTALLFTPPYSAEKVERHLREILKSYEENIRKYLRIPPLGFEREFIEKVQNYIDSSIKYHIAQIEFSIGLLLPAYDSISEMREKIYDILKDGFKEDTFKNLYEAVVSSYEKASIKMFSSDAYLKILNTTLESTLDYLSNYRKITEYTLRFLPVATKTEIEEIAKRLYDIEKRLNEISKIIEKKENKKA